ncbi:hypothetical protein BIV25_13125 [Streptomyces sp. MUSC 14]|uniref:hypothetical protein n=1 Tax=Streptomyces sp. MUSC 14 TaxID=1354889 RepID=UPI0008F575A2|nr:hypothetical protein [Streptomyces sp. MUSC 14]OIJ97745.1 hypothetical protein BIV25_13125 [Streptomyces sp. MUSC 14]
MADVIYGSCAVLIAVSSAVYLYLAWASRLGQSKASPMARRARIAAFTSCLLCSLTSVPAVATAIDTFTGRDGTGTLLTNLAAQVAGFSLQIMTVIWTTEEPRKAVALWLFLLGGVLTVLTVEFHFTDMPSVPLASASPEDGMAAAYMLTHVCLLAVLVSLIGVRYGWMASAVWPSRRGAAIGLAATMAGTVLCLGYTVGRAAAIVSYLRGNPWTLVEAYALPTTGGLALLIATLGLTLPTIRRRIPLPATK